jgi:hypothetical protein
MYSLHLKSQCNPTNCCIQGFWDLNYYSTHRRYLIPTKVLVYDPLPTFNNTCIGEIGGGCQRWLGQVKEHLISCLYIHQIMGLCVIFHVCFKMFFK